MKTFCACVVLSLLCIKTGEAQIDLLPLTTTCGDYENVTVGMIIPRVDRLDTYAVDVINPQPGSTFFVPIGQAVRFYCFCKNYEMVQMLHNDTEVHPRQSCRTILHTIHNVSISDEGMYTCRVQDASDYVCDRPLGNLSTINPNVIKAEPWQYGTLNTHTRLNCSSRLDEFQYLIIYKWFRGHGESRTPLEGWAEFQRTNHSHEGLYTCQVYISSLDIRIEKTMELQIIDRPPTAEPPPMSRTPPTLMTAPTSGSNQIASSATAIRDTLKSQSTFWLIFIATLLLGT